jgi:hypothetical protein
MATRSIKLILGGMAFELYAIVAALTTPPDHSIAIVVGTAGMVMTVVGIDPWGIWRRQVEAS